MRVQVLSSGSKGNAVHIQTKDASLLVDAGLSCRELERRMALVGLSANKLDAVLVTHEHSDHIRGVSLFSRRHKLPVYVARQSWDAAKNYDPDWYGVQTFEPGEELPFKGLVARSFRIPHDTADPVAYIFEHPEGRFGMATDLGHAPEHVVKALYGCDLLLLESNHDERMLREGPYPYFLKKRVASDLGHLSNRQSAELLTRLLHPGLRSVMLGHLSEQNNRPELARKAAQEALHGSGVDLLVALQHQPSTLMKVGES